jgi:hypothetical protein
MCQMCDEYEAELIRMGLIEEAKQVRAERHSKKEVTEPAPERDNAQGGKHVR